MKIVEFTGNTSGVSIGIALRHLTEQKILKKWPKRLILAASGSGIGSCAYWKLPKLHISAAIDV